MDFDEQTQASGGEEVAIPHFDQTTQANKGKQVANPDVFDQIAQANKGKQVATSNKSNQAALNTKYTASVAAWTPSSNPAKAHQSLPSLTTGVHILDAFPAMVAAVKASPNWTAEPDGNPELYKDIKKAMRESIEKQLADEGPAPRVVTMFTKRHDQMIAAGWKAEKLVFEEH